MNLTQEQLAEKFGTSPQAISRWEIGATYPDIEMLPMIASFFETSVDSLLGVTEEDIEKTLFGASKIVRNCRSCKGCSENR